MSYRSPLETRLAKKVTRAITEFGLIEHGDRVMVGLSGGKDSWALMQILDVLRRRAPIDFSLVAVNVNSGYTAFRHDLVTNACAGRQWECRVEHTTIGASPAASRDSTVHSSRSSAAISVGDQVRTPAAVTASTSGSL